MSAPASKIVGVSKPDNNIVIVSPLSNSQFISVEDSNWSTNMSTSASDNIPEKSLDPLEGLRLQYWVSYHRSRTAIYQAMLVSYIDEEVYSDFPDRLPKELVAAYNRAINRAVFSMYKDLEESGQEPQFEQPPSSGIIEVKE